MSGPGPIGVPVTVLTGFLGSGKTTLLNALLRHPGAGRIAVIVNELGDVGIDDLLVEPVAEDVVLVGGGCLCCSVRGDLLTALDGLVARRDAGALPPFERVVVETTGLADPAPVLHTLMGARGPVRGAYLEGLVTVVDGLEGSRQLRDHLECVRQVALADRLVVSKLDLVAAGVLHGLEASLRALNPWAPIGWSAMGSLAPSEVFGAKASPPVGGDRPGHGAWAPFDAAWSASRHAGDTRTFCIIRTQPFSRAVLGMWLSHVLSQFGDRLLRVKGLVQVSDSDGPLVVNAVQHRLYPLARLPAWPSADRRSRLVFIVTGKLEGEVTEMLAHLEDGHATREGPSHGLEYAT
jgi:G3E family GTPase